jgi:hypothetical protein
VQSASRYLKSLAEELKSQSNRVRDLIGNAHWLHEGRHKEHLLGEVVRRHLPAGLQVGTGFVISPSHSICSSEQDLLIVNRLREAPIFDQGGLMMAFPRNVMAAISVKTGFDSTTLRDAVKGLLTVKQVAAASGIDPRGIWCGAYFFRCAESGNEARPAEWYTQSVRDLGCTLDHNGDRILIAPIDVFACSDEHAFIVNTANADELTVRGFNCQGLATAVLLSHVIDHLAVMLDAKRADFADFADVPEVQVLCSVTLKV